MRCPRCRQRELIGDRLVCCPCWRSVPLELKDGLYAHPKGSLERKAAAVGIIRWAVEARQAEASTRAH